MVQQVTETLKKEDLSARKVAEILAQKNDLELKEEYPVFWELLRLKIKKRIEFYEASQL